MFAALFELPQSAGMHVAILSADYASPHGTAWQCCSASAGALSTLEACVQMKVEISWQTRLKIDVQGQSANYVI
jgi:hypothetical protein